MWSLPEFKVTEVRANLHPKKMLVGAINNSSVISHYGITDIHVDNEFILSCGSDGVVRKLDLHTFC